MATEFDFLKQAKPASLHKLLDKLPLADAAVALTGLPASLSVQVMAFFPEKVQGEIMQAMRAARQATDSDLQRVAGSIKQILVGIKQARATEVRPAQPAKSQEPPPSASSSARHAYQDQPPPQARPKVPRPPAGNAKPAPWVPRTATSSPINGPALPGKPPPVSGDPLESPLARAGLLDLIGRAQEKFLPKKSSGPAGPARPTQPRAPAGRQGFAAKKRPDPVEGMAARGSINIGKTPRVIGPAAKRPSAPEEKARPLDGKAIVAAILREAGQTVRANVQEDDPELFRELRHRMFYFDDLIYTEDSSLARVFTTAPVAESSLALRFAAPELRDRVFRVVSPGRAEALRDSYPARAGLDAVEEAQQKVLAVALQLQAAGRILIDPRDPDLAGE